MKRVNKALRHRTVLIVVLAVGFSSVMVQLVVIRELMAGFEDNEFVVALILLIWLLSGGVVLNTACVRAWGIRV